ncbi:ribosome biogenesis protein SPATA5-like [Paramacrobiotus metropolitanus]|uniref:ribosome biogenesis protein SPATA5-like n=1 Tax=Paramacrobiotus metropolitanus TaxID=2943436 RepID=UPI0024463C5A|nr:ribosome biogenesis protein SPATA5-like [Paramacrobiotus metropolitanus]
MSGSTPKSGKKSNKKDTKPRKEYSYSDVGGLTPQIGSLRELVEIPIRQKELWRNLGLKLPRGALLHGPPGTGKTLLCRALISEMAKDGVSCVVVSPLEAVSSAGLSSSGDMEPHLVSAFNNAKGRSPCILFIDNLETFCPKFESGHMTAQESKAVGMLVNLIDELDEVDSSVFLIATCIRPDAVPSILRRPGRFDKEIYIPVPASGPQRLQIFDVLAKQLNHVLTEEQRTELCQGLHGFVGADIAALCFEAGLQTTRRVLKTPEENRLPEDCRIHYQDFVHAKQFIKPSALREVQIEIPKVQWRDIGGQEEIKRRLKESVELPLKYPQLFSEMGIVPPRGILLFGPPGCSKTLIAQAVATESGLNFIAVKGPELYSKWVGESERTLREIFDRARTSAPSVIFIDEIDAIASSRGTAKSGSNVGDRILATFLNEMDGVESMANVVVIAATNRPDVIDKALMRPGRLDRIIYVPLPDEFSRREIFRVRFRKLPVSSAVRDQMDELVRITAEFSGAEITALCQEAALLALDDLIGTSEPVEMKSELEIGFGNMQIAESDKKKEKCPIPGEKAPCTVEMEHFQRARRLVKPRTTAKTVQYYREFAENSALNVE